MRPKSSTRARLLPRKYPPIKRLSRTVILGRMPRPSGIKEIPAATRSSTGTRLSGRSLKAIDPWDRGTKPTIARISVDFPAPLLPRRHTISPSSTLTDARCSAVTCPYLTVIPSTRSICHHQFDGFRSPGIRRFILRCRGVDPHTCHLETSIFSNWNGTIC